jgi:predicted LPLAT superfamily acyltransferase
MKRTRVDAQARNDGPHWARVAESTCVFGMWLLYRIYRIFGRTVFRLCLHPVAFYYWASRPSARRASMQYLRRMQAAHGPFDREPGWRHGLRHIISFAETLLDKMLASGGRYSDTRIRFVGKEPLDDMMARGQGGLFVTAHVGCLEMASASASANPDQRHRLKLNVLVHTGHAQRFNRVLDRFRGGGGTQLLQVGDIGVATAVMLADKVRRGEFVAIAGDRISVSAPRGNGSPESTSEPTGEPTSGTTSELTHGPGRGSARQPTREVRVDFLGHPASLPVGPYVLAMLLQCPLYLLVCLREPGGHVIHFERLAERVCLPRTERQLALTQYAALFARRLELLLASAPFEWFNFFPFWADGSLQHDPRGPRKSDAHRAH